MIDDDLDQIRRDLVSEQTALDEIVAPLNAEQWRAVTPSPGWTIAHQIGHLTFFDAAAATAMLDPDAFATEMNDLIDAALSTGLDDYTLGAFLSLEPLARFDAWRQARSRLNDAACALRDDSRVPWYGPSMGAKSFLTARLMETWAHGTDIADALHVRLPATDRLRHIARLGFNTRKWSYTVHGETMPDGDVRLDLTSPSGQPWTWGDENARNVVRGSAEDFCLVVTQRRHLDDTALVTGELGRHWLLRAQAFAGAPTIRER